MHIIAGFAFIGFFVWAGIAIVGSLNEARNAREVIPVYWPTPEPAPERVVYTPMACPSSAATTQEILAEIRRIIEA